MAFIPVPNTVEATIKFTFGGQEVVITLAWKKASAVSSADLSNLADALETWLTDSLMPILSNGITAVGINLVDLTTSTGIFLDRTFGSAIVGGVNSAAQPNNSAIVTTFRTALRGRSYRGRNYIAGIPTSGLSTTTAISPTFQGQLVGAYADLTDVETATDMDHVVISRQNDGAVRTTGVATPVNSYTVELNLDSQRRRLAGRGS